MPKFSRKNNKPSAGVNQPSNQGSVEGSTNGEEPNKAEMQYMLDKIAELERRQNEQEHKLHYYYRDAVIVSQEISFVDKLCTNYPDTHECITYLGKVCKEYPEIPHCIKDFYN